MISFTYISCSLVKVEHIDFIPLLKCLFDSHSYEISSKLFIKSGIPHFIQISFQFMAALSRIKLFYKAIFDISQLHQSFLIYNISL